MNISLVGVTRERAYRDSKASATYTFSLFDGARRTRPEVVLADGGFEVIQERGKSAQAAARLALEQVVVRGSNALEAPVFLRIPHPHSEYFSKFGRFHESFLQSGQCLAECELESAKL